MESMEESRTLDELDPPAWGPPPSDATSLVLQCHKLRRKPLDDFTAEDLEVLIGQKIALRHLVPRALDVLETNPLTEAFYYPGDLMRSVLGVDATYWHDHQTEWLRMHEIVDGLLSDVDALRDAIEAFRALTQPR